MATEFAEFVQDTVRDDPKHAADLTRVRHVASRLLAYLETPALRATLEKKITRSQDVQSALLPGATDLGFVNEHKGLFGSCKTPGLRPDYFLPVNDTGILLEVEWGKTVKNNMDLLDFWKCHLCEKAHYLFLCVPKDHAHTPKAYQYVHKRLSEFFKPGKTTNVRGLFLFGY
jgi:hypothetical protein